MMDNQEFVNERIAQIQRAKIARELEKQNRTARSSSKGKVTLHTAHCVACNEIISVEAVICPHCGHPDAGAKALEAKVHAEMRARQEQDEKKAKSLKRQIKENSEKETTKARLRKSSLGMSRSLLWAINITTVVALFIGVSGGFVTSPLKEPFMIICFVIVYFTGKKIREKKPEVQQAFDIQENVGDRVPPKLVPIEVNTDFELGDGVAEKLAQIEANRTRERNEPNSSLPSKRD